MEPTEMEPTEERGIQESQLIELYRISREEAYHHDTIHMQIFAALALVTSLFLVAISFIFSDYFHLSSEPIFISCFEVGILNITITITFLKVAILLLFLAVEYVFLRALRRIVKYFETCDAVSKKIETKLPSKFGSLLVGPKLRPLFVTRKRKHLTFEEGWYARNRSKLYTRMAIATFAALMLFLFVFVK